MSMIAVFADQIVEAHRALREKPELRGCYSFVQRKLGIHYNRAVVLIDLLEECRIISPADDDGARTWLIEDAAAVEHYLIGPPTPSSQEPPQPPAA